MSLEAEQCWWAMLPDESSMRDVLGGNGGSSAGYDAQRRVFEGVDGDRRRLAEAGSKCNTHRGPPHAQRRLQQSQHDGPFPQPPYMPSNCGPEYIVLPGLDEALIYDWRGDNEGPPLSTDEVQKTWEIVRGWFPEASTSAGGRGIVASDLEAFTKVVRAAAPTLAALPVVEKEIVRPNSLRCC